MDTMINLNDLLKHEIVDLYSAEQQIIDAMPSMIEKARNPELKKALQEHLRITEEQKTRLDKIKETMSDGETSEGGEKKGFFSRLFGGGNGNGSEKCRGMEGLITEGQKIMDADITEEALDAAIIASAQKIEHYEICGYGTARAFARELKLAEVERLLTQTLNEEYQADDRLTRLAVGKLNIEAEMSTGMSLEGSKSSRGSKSSKARPEDMVARGSRSSKSSGPSKKSPAKSTAKISGPVKNSKSSKSSKSSASKDSSSRRSLRTSTAKKDSKKVTSGSKKGKK